MGGVNTGSMWWGAVVVGILSVGCGMASPVAPGAAQAGGSGSAMAVAADADGASCQVVLHAILREAGAVAVAGQIQVRIRPGEAGQDPVLSYSGVFGPTGDLQYSSLQSSIISRIPDQTPTWTDTQKADPGTTLSEVIRFGQETSIHPELVAALIDNASRFKAIVNVVGSSGGREAEGVVTPERREPESLRERRRLCFGVG